ncbi:MAG: 30S ribosomal protein S21, partial [Bacteroidia bacterium]
KLHKVADPLGVLEHIEEYTIAELDLRNEIKHSKILQNIKKKYEKTGVVKELRKRQAFEKPSVTRRMQKIKAAYKQKMQTQEMQG